MVTTAVSSAKVAVVDSGEAIVIDFCNFINCVLILKQHIRNLTLPL
jgi:hypothetical protein